ncbi:hypothetical protein LDENG_00075400 [Lucifuga dentata]|nr:hypothetical protein LDENG_00075400 [Lucifuga dentata]
MYANCLSEYSRSKPMGKLRRRVQDLCIPSSSYLDFATGRSRLDLSHSESARLAVDSLLSRGLEGYQEVLNAEGEVDFLSELEKNYILANGRELNMSCDDDEELERSADSQSPTRCPALSIDSDPSVADVKCKGALGEPSVEVYFQSDSSAACMKDLALVIVADSFSDIELLCDLLESSRKRNVCVCLLLGRLNLNLFTSMWEDLKLNSKDFPKFSVCSVDGHTYCAKSGRKLTGQIAESFIITDWREVLTGSYSFSWLSWQVHRSLAVHLKGSAVTPFHQEFHRLYTSSKPISGFVTVPLPFDFTSHGAQNDPSGPSQTRTNCHWAWNEERL